MGINSPLRKSHLVRHSLCDEALGHFGMRLKLEGKVCEVSVCPFVSNDIREHTRHGIAAVHLKNGSERT
jgi:hypothetical protein